MAEPTLFYRDDRPLWRIAIVTIPLILGIGILMGRISNSGYGNPWFDALTKPDIMPPGWAFGAAWTILYILLGLAIALIVQARPSETRTRAILAFAGQMLLNFSWSPIFFGARQPDTALIVIIVMLALSIVATFLFWRIDRRAAALMVPYLAWLGFATLLNFRILELNPGA